MADRKISNTNLECSNHQPNNQQKVPMGGGGNYEIKVQGHLDGHWSEWLGGLEIIQTSDANSILTGVIPDQAALHGVLVQIRDLGLTLISITPQPAKIEAKDEIEDSGKDNGE